MMRRMILAALLCACAACSSTRRAVDIKTTAEHTGSLRLQRHDTLSRSVTIEIDSPVVVLESGGGVQGRITVSGRRLRGGSAVNVSASRTAEAAVSGTSAANTRRTSRPGLPWTWLLTLAGCLVAVTVAWRHQKM